MNGFKLLMTLFLVLFLGCQTEENSTNNPQDAIDYPEKATISFTFNGPLYQGDYYSGYLPATGYAVWVEDNDGKFVKTLAISTGMVQVGKYGAKTNHVPVWEASSGVEITGSVTHDSLAYIPEEYDGITGASPSFSGTTPAKTLTFEWNFTDDSGNRVSDGTYRIRAEAGNIEKNKDGSDNPPITIISEDVVATVHSVTGVAVNATASDNITSLEVTAVQE